MLGHPTRQSAFKSWQNFQEQYVNWPKIVWCPGTTSDNCQNYFVTGKLLPGVLYTTIMYLEEIK